MDINAIASAAQNTSVPVGVSVLKQSLDIAAQNAMTLINAIPQPSLPPNLRQNINTTA